jgi:hypothetical protein
MKDKDLTLLAEAYSGILNRLKGSPMKHLIDVAQELTNILDADIIKVKPTEAWQKGSTQYVIRNIKNQDIFERMFDPNQTVKEIRLLAFKNELPQIEMHIIYSKSGKLDVDYIKNVQDALKVFTDMS